MPGCLGLDALWQMVGFFLGWMGGLGKGRALGVGEVKFTGMVLPTAKKITYFVDFKRVIMRKLVLVGSIARRHHDEGGIGDDAELRGQRACGVGLFDSSG